MAILIREKTRCQLCGEVIKQEQPVTAFPAFLQDSHPLTQYSDAVFHAECFEKAPEKEAVQTLFKRFREIWEHCPQHLKSDQEKADWYKKAFKDFS